MHICVVLADTEPLPDVLQSTWLLRFLQACLASDVTFSARTLQGNYQNGGAYTFILLITFWILFSYLVPISLFVTMEIVKFWQVTLSASPAPDAL